MINQTLAVSSLAEAFQCTAAADSSAVALRTPGGGLAITWGEYAARVQRIAGGLAALGVGRGDTVALMMANRPEFHLCDTAALHLGATSFSIYNTSSPPDIAYLLKHARSRVVCCEHQFVLQLRNACSGSAVEHMVCVDTPPEGTIGLEELEARAVPGFDFEAVWRAVGSEDVLTLVYTSGATGPPKGVELTHANMLAQLRASSAVLPIRQGDRVASYLPLAHIADRWSYYGSIAFGRQVTCVADPRAVVAALPDIRPTNWGAVPQLWEKIKAALQAGMAREPDLRHKQALQKAIEVGLRKVRAEQAAIRGDGPGPEAELRAAYARADDLVLAPLRERIGLDQVRWSITGAAPTSMDVLEFFGAIGVPISEVWAMSEISSAGTINPPGRAKLGTVGLPIPGLEVRLAEDGELLCRGQIVMRGYRDDPDTTAEAIDVDGWLRTGDVATIDVDGYVSIVDRKKELIVNAAGKTMSPANIEAKLKRSSPLIGHAVAVGDRRPYNVALVALDSDACAAYASEHGLPDCSVASLCTDVGVHAAIAKGVCAANEELSRVEQIKYFQILPTNWVPGGDELTPTMKLRRKPIAAKYAAEIEALYGGCCVGE